MTLLGKIRAIFVVAALVIGGVFWIAYGVQTEHFRQNLMDRFMQVAPLCRTQILAKNTTAQGTERPFGLGQLTSIAPVTAPHLRTVYTHTMPMGNVAILQKGGTYYLRFRTASGEQWLQNTEPPPSATALLRWYGVALVILGMLYLWLARSLAPLATLHRAVEQIKQGDLSVSTRNPRRDEIAQVANTLDEALRKIEALIQSRQLFLHAIMHELKTPIAKGKLLNAFLEEGEHKLRYEALFDRLDLLLGEFAKIEQMLTANYTLRLADYAVEDLVEHALELMLLDPEELRRHTTCTLHPDASIRTDFNLCTLMLKNLIDNAITHADDHRAYVEATADTVTIRNLGTPLTQPLEAYREPFGASSGGWGLGLYIVLQIADALHCPVTYRHTDGMNIFSFQIG